jgi:hypothetical protein
MRTTPFDTAPLGRFLGRLFLPTILWLTFSAGVLGLLYPHFWLTKPTQLSAVSFEPEGGIQLYQDLFSNWMDPPGICQSTQDLRDVESALCHEFKLLLKEREIMALTPWVFLFVFQLLSVIFFQSVHRQALISVLGGRVKFVGVVLSASKSTFFDRFYLLKPVQVLLPDKKTVTAYLGKELESPKKGQSILIYDLGSGLVGKRYLGVLDNPHVAIIRGS